MIKYRLDIDGLRSIAVLSVVLYHFGVPGLPGGFVGVDVFFVISGYLISKILFSEIREHRFSIVQFYERRARRILPALFAVLAATSAFAYWLFFPTELETFAASLTAASLFSANNYFYFTSDYFAPAAERLPLLHLWSLGVEEQFYLIFPLLLLGLRRYSPAIVRATIISLCILSCAASATLTHLHPTMTFFLLPFRAFELLTGTLVALTPGRPGLQERVGAGAALSGLGAIAVSVLVFRSTTEFPGIAALLPCIGTALVIWGGAGRPSVFSHLLSLSPLVAVGRMSYSLYLVHWPILVFGQQLFPTPMPIGKPVAFIALSVALAALSTRFIERPFRTKTFWPRRKVFAVAFPGILVFCIAAQMTQSANGFPQRFSKDLTTLQAYANYDPAEQFRESRCFLRPEQRMISAENEGLCFPSRGSHHILLWGDSLAAHLFAGLNDASADKGWTLGQATASACAPILGIDAPARPNCRHFNNEVFARIQKDKPDILIVASSWDVRPSDIPALEATLAQIRDAGVNAVILGPTPRYDQPVPNIIAERMLSSNHSRVADGIMSPIVAQADARMRTLAKKYGLRYVSITDHLCTDGNCPLTTPAGVPLQFDSLHLTTQGSRLVADDIASAILTAGETALTK